MVLSFENRVTVLKVLFIESGINAMVPELSSCMHRHDAISGLKRDMKPGRARRSYKNVFGENA